MEQTELDTKQVAKDTRAWLERLHKINKEVIELYKEINHVYETVV